MKFQKRSVLLVVVIAALLFFSSSMVLEAAQTFSFKSKTFDGQPVTSDIFKGNKLTMVNFWATWCPPCVREMPDLASLARSMPKGSRLVGVILDVTTGDDRARSDAEDILERSRADFVQILYDSSMDSFGESVEYIPTTILVDSKGRIIGEPIVGANDEETYRDEIEKALKTL
ncbi:MAG: TlpA family protein disulfide reductase [Synergistaceae bacterium]|jgi:thiol-disulfide isomerase/thioredoxin|nr:TlpA family protein disulfide reductase [Synergistaceae bacterium]